MITFSFAFRGYAEDIPEVAEIITEALAMPLAEATSLVTAALDVDTKVVIQATDDAFGRLFAEIDLVVQQGDYEEDEFEIEVDHAEPDPVVFGYHVIPRMLQQ